jgi:hypothetical protein
LKLKSDKGNNPPKLVNESIVGPIIAHSPGTIIQPNCDYREDFNLKAGNTATEPRPDTYTISCEVTYALQDKIHYKNIDIEVNIFPSLQSMLLGTIVGSVLGTIVRGLTDATKPTPSGSVVDLMHGIVLTFFICPCR